ncbi:DUF4286 family protein [Microbacterium sp. No. 7]|uniref:DUF4286 family protein n=1 Tax=Microbacterium sp. No. 7 TaxID=1714373 RepID=UPI0006D24BF6|nr:DUF4286 family protein [Microbacterium sp. No. 7]ALJ19294.1 hypothetical protein AOA12_04995 [Microbacterium sp. No. 7]
MKFTYVVLTNPTSPEVEDEYNRWYEEQHIPDVLRVPGVESAQRFRLTEQQRGAGPYPYKYLALYSCDAAEPDVVTNGIQERYNTPDMPISPALHADRYANYFEPITEIVSRSE